MSLLAAARRRAEGAHVREWHVDMPDAPATLEALLESMLAWCRETLAATRRPWGIGDFDLALAVASGEGAPRSLSLRFLPATDLYPGDDLRRRLDAFLAAEPRGISHVAVALFPWGEAAHRALPAE